MNLKSLLFFLLSICNFQLFSVQMIYSPQNYDPLLVVVIMVKNEAAVMVPTLQPFVNAGIDSFFVFDTGSTDNTVQITETFFKENNIERGIILQEPFIDFATSRNRALELAEEQFPHAAFMVMIDAEWYMQNVEGLIQFCERCLKGNDLPNSYLIKLMFPSSDIFYTARLIRCKRNMRFVGVVHEVLNPGTAARVPSDVFILYKPKAAGMKKSQERYTRDRDLLLSEHQKNPTDPRTAFYLAQTYSCLGDWENAIKYYALRTELKGWDEENFMAWYRLGECIEQVARSDLSYTWQDALHCYLTAFQMRPSRAEPLVRIAQHYWDTKQYELCYLFAKYACEISFPKNDVLGVIPYYYDYVRYDLIGHRAWYKKQFELGERAIKNALKIYPDKIHLHKNLSYYVDRRRELFIKELLHED